ncbi:MAG TPA: hypothetical protein VJN18_16350 [Polyangiaceae bacterium]|nr:hypothetical protein [Polyangiaceae bacterium]
MNRQTFMLIGSLVAFAVAGLALVWPSGLLASKGVELGAPVSVWVREVGALILAFGVTTFHARKSNDSVALRAVLVGGAVLHLGLLPIELVAYWQGVITKASGVAPNSVLHVTLGLASLHFACSVTQDVRSEEGRRGNDGQTGSDEL